MPTSCGLEVCFIKLHKTGFSDDHPLLIAVIFFHTHVADPAIYIANGTTIYVTPGRTAQITAVVYSSSQNDGSISVEWFYEDTPINTASDPLFSVTMQDTNKYALNIANVDMAVLGRYKAVVSVNGTSQNATFRLVFPGVSLGTTWDFCLL